MKRMSQRSASRRLKVWIAPLALVGQVLWMAAPARADVYMCRDRDGSVTMADRKLKGMRCTLFSKTPAGLSAPAAPADGATPTASGGTATPTMPSDWQPRAPSTNPPRLRDEPAGQREREALYLPWIEQAAEQFDLPVAFIRAVIRVESNFKSTVVSNRGAMGLMQLMPSVVREMGVPDPWDPRANILGGAKLLRRLADRFQGDMIRVLSAYHAGSGAVNGAGGGIPWEATESYVRRVLDHYYRYVDEASTPDTGAMGENTEEDVPEPE